MVADTVYYDLLEVSSTASSEQIRKAYRKLSLIHHPDRQQQAGGSGLDGKPVDHSKFQAINHAYEILSDGEKRQEYDAFGVEGRRGAGASRGGAGSGGYYNDGGMPDMDDIFASMFGHQHPHASASGSGGSRRGGGPAGARQPKSNPVPSPNSNVNLNVTLQDCYKGATKTVMMERTRKCAGCKGTGAKPNTKRRQCVGCHGKGVRHAMRQMGVYITRVPIECPDCEGEGFKVRSQDACKKCQGLRVTKEKKRVSIPIERGLVPGEKIVVRGEGDELPNSSSPGDLHITLIETPHPTFKLSPPASRSAPHDLSTTLSLTLSESILGFSRLILVHLDGRGLRVEQPAPGQPGWRVLQTGDKVVVQGEGMWKKGETGDLILNIEVEMPDEQWASKLNDVKGGLDDLQRLLPPKREDPVNPKETHEVELNRFTEKSKAGASGSYHRRATDSDDEDDDDADEDGDYVGPQCHQQ